MQDERTNSFPKTGLSPKVMDYFRHVSEKSQEAERLLEKDDVRGALIAAEEALRRAGAIPLFIHFANTLSPVYMRAGDYEKAASLFGFRADSNNLSLNAAMAFVMTGRIGEARKSYREVQLLAYHSEFKSYLPGAATAKSVEATVFLGRGYTYYDHGRYASAAWALEHAVRLIPRNPLAQYCYAEVLVKRDRKTEACRHLELAMRLDNGTIGRRARVALTNLSRFTI